MTYSDFITLVKQEVNVVEILPDITTETSLAAEILGRAHIAVR